MVIPQDNHLPYAVFSFRKLRYIVGRYGLFSRLAHIGGNLVQCLCQIGKDIVNMLNPHRQSHITGIDAGISLLFR
jgi:hypothetical protein